MKKYNVQAITEKANVEVPSPIEEPADFEKAIALTGYGKFNYLLLVVALPSAMVSVFDTTTIAYILPAAECDLELNNFSKGALNAIIYAGMISSAFLWGFISDTLGRHKLLVAGYFLDAFFCLASSFAQTLWLMLVLRFFVGFIICGPYAILMSYLAEFHGAQYRSRIIMFTGIFVSIANIILPVLAWALLPQPWSWELFGGYVTYSAWSIFVAICALPSLLSGTLMLLFDESPKFLMSQGRRDEAMTVFKRIYSMNTGRHPDTYPVKVLIDEPALRAATVVTEVAPSKSVFSGLRAGWDQTKPLFLFPHLPKAMLVFSIQVGCLFGMNTLRLWMPQLFATMESYVTRFGHEMNESVSLCHMLTYNMSTILPEADTITNLTMEEIPCTVTMLEDRIYINSIVVGGTSALCYLSAGYLVNALGKKKILILGFFIAGVCGIAVYWSVSYDFTLALLSLYLAFCGICSTAVLGVVVDVFPTSLRTMAVSLTMMFGRTGSLFGNLIFPVFLDLSCEVPFFLVGAVILGCSAASFFLPVTKGKALE